MKGKTVNTATKPYRVNETVVVLSLARVPFLLTNGPLMATPHSALKIPQLLPFLPGPGYVDREAEGAAVNV